MSKVWGYPALNWVYKCYLYNHYRLIRQDVQQLHQRSFWQFNKLSVCYVTFRKNKRNSSRKWQEVLGGLVKGLLSRYHEPVYKSLLKVENSYWSLHKLLRGSGSNLPSFWGERLFLPWYFETKSFFHRKEELNRYSRQPFLVQFLSFAQVEVWHFLNL